MVLFCLMATEEIIRGNTFDQEIQITDVDGNFVDITGGTVTITFRNYANVIIDSFSQTSHIDALNGKTILSWTDDESALFPLGNFPCDIVFVSAAGDTFTVIRQRLLVSINQNA